MKRDISPSYRRKLLPVVEAVILAQIEAATKQGKVIAAHLRSNDTDQAVDMSVEQQTLFGAGIAAAVVIPLHKLQPKGTHSRISLNDEQTAKLVADVLLARKEFEGFAVERDNIAEVIAAEAIVQRQAELINKQGKTYAGQIEQG